MPQPLSTVLPRPTAPLEIGAGALKERSVLSGLVMQVIGNWSQAEYHMYPLVTKFLNADFTVVAAMLTALHSTQRDAIRAAAEEALSPEDFDLFTAVDSAINPTRKLRDQFSHGIWACTDDLPNDLILGDPKYLSMVDAKSQAWWRKHQFGKLGEALELIS